MPLAATTRRDAPLTESERKFVHVYVIALTVCALALLQFERLSQFLHSQQLHIRTHMQFFFYSFTHTQHEEEYIDFVLCLLAGFALYL